jgi:N-acetyltransferase
MTFDFQPVLDGPTLHLRPMRAEDRDALFDAASDPLIWEVHPATDRWQRPKFDLFFDDCLKSGGTLVVEHKSSGCIIGSSRFDTGFVKNDEIEIGWTFLQRDFWGGQTNFELKRLMIGHALWHFQHVIFRIGESNLRSRRAIEKIGTRLTERREMVDMGAGRLVPYVSYEMDEALFRASPINQN